MRLEDELKTVLIEGLKLEDVEADDLGDDDPLFGEGLGLDSLDAVELVLLIKKRYGVEIQDMEEARVAFVSIKALADHIRARQSGS